MSLSSQEQPAFLPQRFTNIVDKLDHVQEQLVYPNQEYSSARAQLSHTSSNAAMIISGFTRMLSIAELALSISDAESTERLEAILTMNGLNSLLIDSKHAVLGGVAALATGVSLSAGNSDIARYGFELGSRIISQRARLNAQSLIVCLLNSKADLGFDGGRDLLTVASRFYDSGRKNMSPLARVPRSVGSHFDEISNRVYSEENFDNSHVTAIDFGHRGRGPLGRRGVSLKTLKAGSKIGKKARNPDTAIEVVEEIFDTYLGYPLLRMEDRETLLVANFAQKVLRYYEIAGRAIPEIRHDPRTRYMGLLVNKLSGMNIPKAEEQFKKTAHDVSKEAA